MRTRLNGEEKGDEVEHLETARSKSLLRSLSLSLAMSHNKHAERRSRRGEVHVRMYGRLIRFVPDKDTSLIIKSASFVSAGLPPVHTLHALPCALAPTAPRPRALETSSRVVYAHAADFLLALVAARSLINRHGINWISVVSVNNRLVRLARSLRAPPYVP